MLYFAIGLVAIGILCIIYFTLQQPEEKGRTHPDLKESLFNARYPESRSNLFDEQIVRDRQLRTRMPEVVSPQGEDEEGPEEPVPGAMAPEIVDSTEVVGEDLEAEETPFRMEGILYLDYGRKIPFADKNLREKRLLEEFNGLKRSGETLLTVEKGVFHFKTPNAVYSYAADELEQIVFLEEGFVMIPVDRKLPAPVLLTDNVSAMKNYLVEKKKAEAASA